uniref:Uncharacterized protein n=1 Tax=Serinus canaria TaxID=9135 RepID=A0A8C9KTW7_SERCA
MSRKQQPKDPSWFVFDARSGAVRAQGGASENMREKVPKTLPHSPDFP